MISESSTIPGLFVYEGFFPSVVCQSIVNDTLILYTQLEQSLDSNQTNEVSEFARPKFVRSAAHNLASEEHFVRVILPDGPDRQLSCEYFPRYGEAGHGLAYFHGQQNIPTTIAAKTLDEVRRKMEDIGLVSREQELLWKLTVNFYKNVAGTIAGFPFHVDIPSNGVVTMILNVQREVLFQITDGTTVVDIQIPIGCLLVLSGASRYEWKHRVVPMKSQCASEGEIERVSLVLGFQ
jgi:hypothetical protein